MFDCRESGASLDDVVDKTLQFYRDRHPKLQEFDYLHCWQVLRDVLRWWDSPVDVQRRSVEISPRAVGMGKRKSPPTIAPEVGMADEPSASDEEAVVASGLLSLSTTGFPPRPTRPHGSKATKAELVQQKKLEKILHSQAIATKTMAEASFRKANALQDQCAMSLFTMPLEKGMTEEARKYFALRWQEIHPLERCMRLERRAAELEELEHAKLLKAGNLDQTTLKICEVAAPVATHVDTPPPWAPSPTTADSGAAGAGETPRDLPVFTGTNPNPTIEIVGIRVSRSLMGLVV